MCIGSKKPRKSSSGTQTPLEAQRQDKVMQCDIPKGSYARDERKQIKWRYDDLIVLLNDKDRLIQWLMGEGLLAKSRLCSICGGDMNLFNCDDRFCKYSKKFSTISLRLLGLSM